MSYWSDYSWLIRSRWWHFQTHMHRIEIFWWMRNSSLKKAGKVVILRGTLSQTCCRAPTTGTGLVLGRCGTAPRAGKLWRHLLWCAPMPVTTAIDTLHVHHVVIGGITILQRHQIVEHLPAQRRP